MAQHTAEESWRLSNTWTSPRELLNCVNVKEKDLVDLGGVLD